MTGPTATGMPNGVVAPSSTLPTAQAHRNPKPPCACAHLHHGKTCLSFVVSSFGRSFYLAYGIRAGISLALHLIRLVRTNPRHLLDLNKVVGAHGLPVDAVRMGLFLGGFCGIYNGVRCLLARWLKRDDASTVLAAGGLASLSILFHSHDSHRTLSLYVLARVVQCWYNYQKRQGRWHLWGSDWKHGDTLLFSLCTAQVMYAYVMRPETLPAAYWKFIVDTGPIPIPILDASRANCRGLPIQIPAVQACINKVATEKVKQLAKQGAQVAYGEGGVERVLRPLAEYAYGKGASPALPPSLPCAILHSHNPYCTVQWLETFINGVKRVAPVYTSITFVPMVVLRFWTLVKHPVESILKGLWSVSRSTMFLSSFVTLYMFLICARQRITIYDHRAVYWLAGFISSWTILFEQKSRRSELALYVLPRAIDSWVMTMQDRKLLANIPHGEKGLFALGMAALMYYREFHPECMSPLLRRLLNFFVPTSKSVTSTSHAGSDADSVKMKTMEAAAMMPSTHSMSVADGALTSSGVANGCDSPSRSMIRSESDQFIPLPSAGIPLSREQSIEDAARRSREEEEAAVCSSEVAAGHSHSLSTSEADSTDDSSLPYPYDMSPSPNEHAHSVVGFSHHHHSHPNNTHESTHTANTTAAPSSSTALTAPSGPTPSPPSAFPSSLPTSASTNSKDADSAAAAHAQSHSPSPSQSQRLGGSEGFVPSEVDKIERRQGQAQGQGQSQAETGEHGHGHGRRRHRQRK